MKRKVKTLMTKKQSKQVSKEDLRQMKAYIKYEQTANKAEIDRKTDKYSHLADIRNMDCTIYSEGDYNLFKMFVENKELFKDMYTEEQWKSLEAGVKLFELNGHQTIQVKDEHYDIVDSLASEATIAEISKKIGKKK